MNTIIEVTNLKKSYGDLEVLRGIDFSVEQGEIFAILGPNGAGKTTCVEILEGYRSADAGKISILGLEPKSLSTKFKERIGIVVQTSGIEGEITPKEALALYASCYKSPKNPAELLELMQLTDKANSKIDKLSGGQRRRLDLALGLVGDPDILFLDEPTTGFSPEARRRTWEMLENLKNEGKTILLTSHYMEEVERLADRMIILLNGKVVLSGRPQDLRQGITRIDFLIPSVWTDFEGWLKSNDKVQEYKIENNAVCILTYSPTELLRKLTDTAMSLKAELQNLSVHLMELEDIYLETINQPAGSAGDGNSVQPANGNVDSYMGDG